MQRLYRSLACTEPPPPHSGTPVVFAILIFTLNFLLSNGTVVSLLGASYQLSHSVDNPCTLPSPPSTLILFDISGAHVVQITYCFCDLNNQCQYGKRWVQLLHAGWFLASWHHPGTAFTLCLLNFTHKLQTRSKINLFDFHAALGSISNSTTPAVHVGLSMHPLYT